MISALKKAGFLVMVGGILLMIPGLGAAAQDGGSFSGSAEAGYRFRTDGTNSDADWVERLYLQGFTPWKLLGDGTEVGFVFLGALQEDVDGKPKPGKFDRFRDIADSYEDSTVGWLYLAYGELKSPGTLQLLRAGRQDLLELEPIAFDGGLVCVRPLSKVNLRLTAFGGVPTNLYELNDHREGDSVLGGYLDWRVLRSLSLRAGYLSLRDQVALLDGAERTLDEGLAVLQTAWNPTREDSWLGRVTLQDGELRDVTVRSSHRDEDRNFNLSAYYTGLYLTREVLPLTEDPFSILLSDYHPYHQAGLTAYKGMGERLGVEGGAVVRRLFDQDQENRYNHSWERYFLSLSVNKVPLAKSQFMIGADWWVAEESHNETRSLRAEYDQRLGKGGFFRVGTAFDLYKVDEFTGEERVDVQTYYTNLGVPVWKKLMVLAGYSFEDSRLREVDTFRARVRYEF